LNRQKALRVLAELERRKLSKPKWLNPNFPKQNEFITSVAPFKSLQCTRRAGKSYSGGLYAFKEAYETPGCSVLIIGLTRDSVKRIFFKDILKEINKKFKVRAKTNASDLTFTLPNGSVIYLLGVDANPDDMNKLLGQKNKLVVVDEAAFYRQNMNKLVYEILKPSVADYEGTIALISTTSNLTGTLYHDITTNKEKGWMNFQWTTYDNPYMSKKWDNEISFLVENKPGIEQTASFRRMYLNQWVVDKDALVYKYSDNNITSELPEGHRWSYVLGIDLGYNDDTSFVTCAYSEYDPNLYVIDAFKASNMIVSDVASKIKELDAIYNYDTFVIDNASKQVVEEIKQRHHIPLIAAEKTDKRGYIEMLNSDLITKNIQILPKAKELTVEWDTLVWDERELEKKKYVEHPKCPNHLSDAFLYAWRWCYNYAAIPRIKIPLAKSEEEVDSFWQREADLQEERNNARMLDVAEY